MAEDARISTALPSHPKTKKLRKRLGIEGCWSLLCLFLWAATNRWSGDLSGLSDEDIELAAEWDGDPGTFVQALADVRFLDGKSGEFVIHDWREHNPWAAARGERTENARKAAVVRWNGQGQRAESLQDACAPHAECMRDVQKGNAPNPTQPNPIHTQPTKNKKPFIPEPVQQQKTTANGVSGLSEIAPAEKTKPKATASSSAIPDWIPTEAWDGFVEMRKRVRAPMTDRAVRLLIAKLARLRDQREDVGAVLDQSTANSWKGVFPTKRDRARSDQHTGFEQRDYTAGLQANGDGTYRL